MRAAIGLYPHGSGYAIKYGCGSSAVPVSGFKETGNYYPNPLSGAQYMALDMEEV